MRHLGGIASSDKDVQVGLLKCFNECGANATGTTASHKGNLESHDSEAVWREYTNAEWREKGNHSDAEFDLRSGFRQRRVIAVGGEKG